MILLSVRSGIFSLIVSIFLITGCNQNPKQKSGEDPSEQKEPSYKVTFIELGSVRCIPCREMQTVMKSIEQKYGTQVKIVFHDVWTQEGAPYGQKYGIEAIPTQIFLDKDGKEYFRHTGYFPEKDLTEVLKLKGVN